MKKRCAGAIAALMVVAVPLVGCSSDSDDAAKDTATTEATTESTAMSDNSMSDNSMSDADMGDADMGDTGQSGDIVATAEAAGDFTTLVTAVQAAGLTDTLSGPGPFTVFAPTDEAFDKLPAGTLDELLKEPTGQLKDILTYHVVAGEVMAKDVAGMDGQEVDTVNGAKLKVGVSDDGKVSLTDAAGNTVNVVKTDVAASNGVIHVIDGVLMPG